MMMIMMFIILYDVILVYFVCFSFVVAAAAVAVADQDFERAIRVIFAQDPRGDSAKKTWEKRGEKRGIYTEKGGI